MQFALKTSNLPSPQQNKANDATVSLQSFGKSYEDLQKEIDCKKNLLQNVKSTEENLEKLEKIKEKKLKMEKRLLENKLRLENYSTMSKKYNTELSKVQVEFNATVDPFNNTRKISATNKQSYQAMAKAYAGIDKRIEIAKIQHRRKGKRSSHQNSVHLISFSCSWSHGWKLSSCEVQDHKAEGEAKLLEGTF
jgi:hypothetical protein